MYDTIYENSPLLVLYDETDRTLPIGFEIYEERTWLSDAEFDKMAAAIQKKIGTPDEKAVVRASEVSFNEGLMRLAAVHGKTVAFRYAKGDGQVIESRRLQPSEVQEVKGNVIFLGHDPDRDDVRAYRVDRIKGDITIEG